MGDDAVTIDKKKLAEAAGDVAANLAKSAAAPAINLLESAKDMGIGGSLIDDLLTWFKDIFSKIGNILASIFGGSEAPTPAPTDVPAPNLAASGTETPAAGNDVAVTPPGKTPPGAPAAAPNRNVAAR